MIEIILKFSDFYSIVPDKYILIYYSLGILSSSVHICWMNKVNKRIEELNKWMSEWI